MACYHPISAYKDFHDLHDSGKPKIKFDLTYCKGAYEPVELPCGRCIGCRLAYSREWANRCYLEGLQSKDSFFLTLTYDNVHLPANSTLDKRDLTLFMKRLRTYYERFMSHQGIRFFGCGEYGSKRSRPHYHIICWNLPIYDLIYYKTTKLGHKLYRSPIVEKIWGRGSVVIGLVTWESCAYTARYVLKKRKGKGSKLYYERIKQVPEFTRMSRMPGIAREYYDKNKDVIYRSDEIIIKTSDGDSQVAKPPGYYDRLYDVNNHTQLTRLKRLRKVTAEAKINIELERTTLSKCEYLELKERSKTEQSKYLQRCFELE